MRKLKKDLNKKMIARPKILKIEKKIGAEKLDGDDDRIKIGKNRGKSGAGFDFGKTCAQIIETVSPRINVENGREASLRGRTGNVIKTFGSEAKTGKTRKRGHGGKIILHGNLKRESGRRIIGGEGELRRRLGK
jgi:hypothetical protein